MLISGKTGRRLNRVCIALLQIILCMSIGTVQQDFLLHLIFLIQQLQHWPSCRHPSSCELYFTLVIPTTLQLCFTWFIFYRVSQKKDKNLSTMNRVIIDFWKRNKFASKACDTLLLMQSQLWNSSSIDGRFQFPERQRSSKLFFRNFPTELSSYNVQAILIRQFALLYVL